MPLERSAPTPGVAILLVEFVLGMLGRGLAGGGWVTRGGVLFGCLRAVLGPGRPLVSRGRRCSFVVWWG